MDFNGAWNWWCVTFGGDESSAGSLDGYDALLPPGEQFGLGM